MAFSLTESLINSLPVSPRRALSCISISGDGEYIAVGDENNKMLFVWGLRKPQSLIRNFPLDMCPLSVCLGESIQTVAVGGQAFVRILNDHSDVVIPVPNISAANMICRVDKEFFVACGDGSVLIISPSREGYSSSILFSNSSGGPCMDIASSLSLIVGVNRRGELRLWDSDGEVLGEWDVSKRLLDSSSSPDILATCCAVDSSATWIAVAGALRPPVKGAESKAFLSVAPVATVKSCELETSPPRCVVSVDLSEANVPGPISRISFIERDEGIGIIAACWSRPEIFVFDCRGVLDSSYVFMKGGSRAVDTQAVMALDVRDAS